MRGKPPKPPLATLSSGRARNGGLGVIACRATTCFVEQTFEDVLMGNRLSCCYSFRELIFLSPTGELHFLFLPPPSSFCTFVSSHDFRTRICLSSTPWFSNFAGLCRLLCLDPLKHTVNAQGCSQSWIRGIFSISDPLRLPLLSAQPCSHCAEP